MTNLAFALYDAPLWNMALIASKLHLVWIATVCGKLKTDFRYSNTLGWNTFPVPSLTAKNKADLTAAAQNILLAREAHFPAIRAINEAIKALETLPLSNRLLRQTHATLMQGVRGEHKRPGEFRSSQNWIGVSLKNAAFVPPHHEHVPDLMADLERFLHADDIFVHPLLRIAIAHYQFETIHPFLDGNGRLGRLMISLYLASEGLLAKPALYLSDYFERNKTAYVDHLMAVRQGNHLRAWLVFFLHGVEETARSAADAFRAILELKARIEGDVLPRFSTRRQNNAQALMRYLYGRPVIDVKAVAALTGSTANTASALISDLVEYGVLTEITGQQRNRLFVFQDYIALFRR